MGHHLTSTRVKLNEAELKVDLNKLAFSWRRVVFAKTILDGATKSQKRDSVEEVERIGISVVGLRPSNRKTFQFLPAEGPLICGKISFVYRYRRAAIRHNDHFFFVEFRLCTRYFRRRIGYFGIESKGDMNRFQCFPEGVKFWVNITVFLYCFFSFSSMSCIP